MIRGIDHNEPSVARRIVAIQKAAYAVEADLMGFDGIPPLSEGDTEVQALTGLTWMAAFDGDTMVGVIAWSEHGDSVEIDRLAVDPQWSRHGYGRALVRSIPMAPVMDVSTGELNYPAVALYESEGYGKVATTEVAPGIFTTQFQLRHEHAQRKKQPTHNVLAAFGLPLSTTMHALSGSEEVSVRAGSTVLKRVLDPAVARWCQALLAKAPVSDEFRLPRPLQSLDGQWEVDGWIATEFIGGLESLRHHPRRIIRVGESLCDCLTHATSGDPTAVRLRHDRWARADRFAWEEQPVELTDEAADLCGLLRQRMAPCQEIQQVVHGDLSGNVFQDPTGKAVVLDFSPFIRPKRYGSAIVVADNLVWNGGSPALARLIGDDEDGLARALVFRLVADQLATTSPRLDHMAQYRRIIAELGWSRHAN